MFTFERTHDMELVRKIMTHPRIYPHITDDASPSAQEFRPVEHPAVWYILVYLDGEVAGVFVASQQTSACFEAHVCLLPNCWGHSAEAARECCAWLFGKTDALRVVASVPGCNWLAGKMARKTGMRPYGVNPFSFRRGGKVYFLELFGLSKEDC